jgi:hypothetical protein
VDLKNIEKFSTLPPGMIDLIAEATASAGTVELSGEKDPVRVGRVKPGSRRVRFCLKFKAIWT